jgi:uncharacterized protein (TIGR00661 family)
MKSILYGICGIGNGHTYRQLPTVEYLVKRHKVLIFAYGDSLAFFSRRFADHPSVKVAQVAVPYYVGNTTGLDFAATEKRIKASGIDYVAINAKALAEAEAYLGRPDVVISDYEPVSAHYAYACDAPLVTIDQQSKYLAGEFPGILNGQTYADEVARLRLFFPKADARIACSFFKVSTTRESEKVLIYPSVLRSEIVAIKRTAKRQTDAVLVYLTAQAGRKQALKNILKIFATQPATQFQVFVHATEASSTSFKNITIHHHGDPIFETLLTSCSAIIATAGHTLLSEAMYLGVPVLAMPLALYEQQMNARALQVNGFGMSAEQLTPKLLSEFLNNHDHFTARIKSDKTVLVRGDGGQRIIKFLERKYLSKS